MMRKMYDACTLIWCRCLRRWQQLAGSPVRNRRHQRGSIDFDFPESKIMLDEEGHPVEIRAYDQQCGHEDDRRFHAAGQ